MQLNMRAWLIAVAGVSMIAMSASAQPRTLSTAGSDAGDAPLDIDWANARRQMHGDMAQRSADFDAKFVEANREEIDRIKIPILVPGNPVLARNLVLISVGHGWHYTLSSRSGDLTFVLSGHGRAFRLAQAAERRLLTGKGLAGRIPQDKIVIEQGEGGIDASFRRFGAAYSISLECADPEKDPRCNNDAFIRRVIQRLMVVTPAGAGQ